MILVKLGGSVITDKERLRRFRKTACSRLCKELKSAKGDLIVIHGAGSFGHIIASKAQLHLGVKKNDLKKLRQVALVHRDVLDLNAKVIGCMAERKLHGFSLAPHTVASFSGGKMIGFCPEKFQMLLENDLIPVSFGDVVPDRELTFSICSGDLLMLALGEHFKPEMAVFVADVDGVFDKDPKEYKGAKLLGEISKKNIGKVSAGTRDKDVTGAMRGKLARMTEIAKHCENTIILNGNAEGRLGSALKGEEVVSTRVVA